LRGITRRCQASSVAGHRERLFLSTSPDQLRQRREPQKVGWLVTNLADLAAEDRVLVAEYQELSVLG
jgi:hypothetical protein